MNGSERYSLNWGFHGILLSLLGFSRFLGINRDFSYCCRVNFTNSWTAFNVRPAVLLIQCTLQWVPLTTAGRFYFFSSLFSIFDVKRMEEDSSIFFLEILWDARKLIFCRIFPIFLLLFFEYSLHPLSDSLGFFIDPFFPSSFLYSFLWGNMTAGVTADCNLFFYDITTSNSTANSWR